MILYPAIDLRGGQVVRLKEGDPNQQTIFSNNPLQTAEEWLGQGATWLHVVNLDGAFGQNSPNLAILEQLAQIAPQVQFGGGLRQMADIETALKKGASRVVLGTVAIQNPAIVQDAVREFGADAICVALDARDGKVTTHGWQTVSDLTPTALGLAMAQVGVRHALFTDVSRDGGLQGVALNETIALAQATQLQVIASGGVSQLHELHTLASSGVVAGAIVGMALYTGQFSVRDALATIQSASQPLNNKE